MTTCNTGVTCIQMISPSRRTFLETAAAAALPLASWTQAVDTGFRHRGYLGWITDLSSRPDSDAQWPSMRLDTALLRDYQQSCRLLKDLGFNELVVWGLYVANDWPVDISSAVTPERGAMVERLIETAHRNGLRVLNGLGVYSWGYKNIIAANPHLNRGNPNAMCASEPDSWKWMQKILDYTFDRFPVDGTSMQSADLGRCKCDRCSRWSDAEYHARINIRTAEYIRSRWKDKVIGVSGWGMKFDDPANLPFLVDLSRRIDYLIDVPGTARTPDLAYRGKLIRELKCDFGTLGGMQVEPPQHWERDRWFLPTAKYDGDHLGKLRADGGRACEYFYHILENPGDELSVRVAGKCLSSPDVPWRHHLRSSVEQLYRVSRPGTLDALCEAFLRAEDAYMKHIPPDRSGTISMEPLVSNKPGPPVYLSKRLSKEQRQQYRKDLAAVSEDFRKLAADIPEKGRISTILRCLKNVQRDVQTADAA